MTAFTFHGNGVGVKGHNTSMLQDKRRATQAKRPATIARNGPFV
jgi:hypothetical protein